MEEGSKGWNGITVLSCAAYFFFPFLVFGKSLGEAGFKSA